MKKGRPPKARSTPDEYQSAIAAHLASNEHCCKAYKDSDFRVISRGRSKSHLDVLEAVYICECDPVLCKQKNFVTYLKLFRHAHSHTLSHTHSNIVRTSSSQVPV